ncbi:MAG: UrcA family protein [Alphaproteobacteria bacterium]
MKRNKLLAAAIAASVFVCSSVIAAEVFEVVVTSTRAPTPGREFKSKTVTYADLDLSKQAGAQELVKRIRGAAEFVCSPKPNATDIKASDDYTKCVNTAFGNAVAHVDNPLVTSVAKT